VTAALVSILLAAAAPEIQNARLSTRSAAGGLAPVVEAAWRAGAAPRWIGWSVPVERPHRTCCWDHDTPPAGGCCGCRLEGDGGFSMGRQAGVRLEADGTGLVLLRGEQGRVGRVRMFSSGCGLDAGGLPVLWLTDVVPAESLRLLASYASADRAETRESVAEGALAAIAFHAGASADAVLEGFTRPERAEALRKQAGFWLGTARGRRGYLVLERLVKDDPSDDVRAHVTFALSQSEVPEAVPAIMRAARQDPSSRVRSQALFWLAQKAGEKAAAAITRAIDDDPDAEVKEKAVFALSQLPRDEGVPRLIAVARSNRNREVRKKAMFWLGQSDDPRALAFIEDVLTN
jgi:hypothetical protein